MATFWYHERHLKSYPSAKFILGEIKKFHSFDSVADLGCGVGTWLFTAKELGASTVQGLDGSTIDPEHMKISQSEFKNFDLNKPLSIEKKFDLAISLEVAEHINSQFIDNYFKLLTSLSPIVLFSGAIPGQGGHGHINEQEPDYWIGKFTENGFKLFDVIRPIIWNHSEVLPWYKQNCMLFIKENELLVLQEKLKNLEDWKGRYIIHPHFFNKYSFLTKIKNNPLQFVKDLARSR